MATSPVKLVIGCGYLGLRVARLWRDQGARVVAVTRSRERAAAFANEGLTPVVADILQPDSLAKLPMAETVLFAVGHGRQADVSIERLYVAGLAYVLAALPRPPARFIYISSTGVYGQVDGDEVTEDSPCQPTREGGRACLAAEALLEQSALADRAIILRLAGIYGPGRIPRSADIRNGAPIAAPAEGYVNLIHVDDAAQIVLAMEALSPPRKYLVSDGHSVRRAAYYGELARLLSAPAPTFAAPDPHTHAAQRAGSDKRVSSAKLLREAKIELQYPTYREGLAQIVKEQQR